MTNPKELLEAIVDCSGLFGTIEMLEVICEEKAEHCRVNWQDEALSKAWLRAAFELNKCANTRAIAAVTIDQ
jgi:hypothetical protein